MRKSRAATAAIAILTLGACSTIDVTLEKDGDGKGASVSAIAKAPTNVSMQELIVKTNFAMALACESVVAIPKSINLGVEVLSYPGISKFVGDSRETIGAVTELAKETRELLETLRGWFPENTYTAARKCQSGPMSAEEE